MKYEKASARAIEFNKDVWLTAGSPENYPTVAAFIITGLGCEPYAYKSTNEFTCGDFSGGGVHQVKINGVLVTITIEHHQGGGNSKWECSGYNGGT